MLVTPVAQKHSTKDGQLNTVLGDYRRKINEITDSSLKETFVQSSEPRNVEAGTLWLDLSEEGDEPTVDFLDLPDTPANYTGAANKFVKVNATPDGLEFVAESTIDHDVLTNTHANPYKLDDLAVPDDNTDLDVSITKHGLTPKAPNDITKFLRGDASWGVPAGGGGDEISEGDSKVEVVDLGTGYIQTLADNQQVRKDQILGNLQPLQPAFQADNSGSDVNVTGDGTSYTIDFDRERFDQGGDFTGDTFTAPVPGKYLLTFQVMLFDLDEDTYERIRSQIVTSNRTYERHVPGLYYAQYGWLSEGFSIIVDMDANDTAHFTITVIGGAKNIDTATTQTFCSGALIC